MQPKAPVLQGMAAAFAVALVIAAAVRAQYGTDWRATNTALQMTARFSFLLFWLAYAGGGLAVLMGPFAPLTAQSLRQHGRDFGLSFAAAHLVHIGLVGWLIWIGAPPHRDVFVFFVPPLVVVYLLALFSLPVLQAWLGRGPWAVLRTVGLTYIAYAFATDFLGDPFSVEPVHLILYSPFALLSVLGPVLHVLGLVAPFWREQQPAQAD
jgi:hypothetical protein